MKATWRLLTTPPSRGAWNMAVDEAILEGIQADGALPTLRLYAWQPACLSLGYAQPSSDVDLPALQKRGWDLVRRPTGGRAVLHTDELTYSVIAPPGEPRLAGTLLESYNRLAAALLEALRLLGLPAEAQEKNPPAGRNTNPVCFEVPSSYEITVLGKKMIGSAQARRRQGVLQHGSLPLGGDLTRILQVLVFKDEESRLQAARRLLQRATTAEAVLGRPVSWEQAAACMRQAWETVLELQLVEGVLSPLEQERARQLADGKYARVDPQKD